MLTDDGMFIGKEVEHTNHYSVPTLFVAKASYSRVLSLLCQHPDIKHVYLGAGGLGAVVDLSVAASLLDARYSITIEYSGFPDEVGTLLEHPNLTVVLPFTLLGKRVLDSDVLLRWLDCKATNVFVKIDTHHPHCWQIPIQQLVNTWTKPQHYNEDQPL